MTDAKDDSPKGERIAKRLARAGLCSRRDAERWIEDGRVSVDGRKLTSPALVVGTDALILVDGKPIPEAEQTRLWRYHKPAGLVTSHKDPEGRPTVFERLPDDLPRVISVGRLDLNSEGLLLLTNDGALARRMEMPSTGWIRRYRVRVHGAPTVEQLATLDKGVTIEGVGYGPIKALVDRQQGSNAWLTVSLKEGKNREIRRVMEYLGWSVTRLIRIAYGPFQLGLLEPGSVDEVSGRVLREQLGSRGEAPAKPLHGAKAARSAQAAQAAKPTQTMKPSQGGKATRTEKPARTATPGHASNTGHANRRRPS